MTFDNDWQFQPAIQYPAKWDQPLPALAQQGIELFNQGEYFEQHELLELAWRAEPEPIRDLYQGILQVGVAFLHIQRNNWAGAVKLLGRGLPKLLRLPPICQTIDLATFCREVQAIQTTILELGPTRLHEFDQTKFPTLIYRKCEEKPGFWQKPGF